MPIVGNITISHSEDRWSSVLRPRQHSIGYMGDGFYRSRPYQQYQSTEETHTVHK